MFNEEVLENAHSQLSDFWPLLQGLGHFSQQQAHQEVVTAVFFCQAELQRYPKMSQSLAKTLGQQDLTDYKMRY